MAKEVQLKIWREEYNFEMIPLYYISNRSLAIQLIEKDSGEEYGMLTVCLGEGPGLNKAYIDVNNMGDGIVEQLVSCGVGKPTGGTRKSGFVIYPEFEFDGNILKECGSGEYEQYLKWYADLTEDEEYLIASCRRCDKKFPFIVKKTAAEQYREYENGAPYLIQDIFPDMSAGERGLFARGQNVCDACFKKMLGIS